MQCGVIDMHRVIPIFEGEKVRYTTTLAVVFKETNVKMPMLAPPYPFVNCWRPVLAFAKGKREGMRPCLDACTTDTREWTYHPCEQPLKPWLYWLDRLTMPGELIVDPFAGSGTTGVAAKMLGRSYLGTEVDEGHARVARGRLAETEEGEGS